MAESSNPSQSQGLSANKSAVVEINQSTLKNALIPEIKKVLVERINPDFGILDNLLASKALSRSEFTKVTNLSGPDAKNSLLLELATENEKLTELFNALKDTNQEHLVNYATAKGEYKQDYGGAWPLMERQTSILDANQGSLSEILDFTGNEIVNELYSREVLNKRQKEFICARSCDQEKAQTLLDILYRSSMSDYSKMIHCLLVTNQNNVAKILLDGGAVVRVHNTVAGDTEAVMTAEKEIVERIDSALSSMSLEESRCLLEKLHLKVLAARTGHSVILYVLCETIDELMHLSKRLASGELQSDIEQLFNQLISRTEKVQVLTSVSEETVNKCTMFLEVDRSHEKVSSEDILKLCEQMEGTSEELPSEAERNVSPTRREPRHGEGYTVIPPDEKKRQSIQRRISQELPSEAGRNVSPTCREPRRGEGYTVIPPDEKKRQSIQRQAEEEKRKYEEHRAENRPRYSIIATLGGAGDSSSGASDASETKRKMSTQGPTLTPQQKVQKYKEEKKQREEKEYEQMKQAARQKTDENEKRERERVERLREDEKRKRSAFLDKIEGKSSGNATGRPTDASSSASQPPASASGGVEEGTEMPGFADGVAQLASMFPWVEKDVLKSLLKEAGNNVDDVAQFLS